jgi:hypothetical protein
MGALSLFRSVVAGAYCFAAADGVGGAGRRCTVIRAVPLLFL